MTAQPAWIDADAHILEPTEVWKRVDKAYRDRIRINYLTDDPTWREFPVAYDVFLDGLPIPIWLNGERKTRFDRLLPTFQAKYELGSGSVPAQYIKDLDREGLAEVVIYPTLFLWAPWMPQLGAAFSGALARAYNDWIHEFCQTAPKRLHPAVALSLHDVDEAVREVHRCAKLGFVGVFVRPNPLYGRTLGHPDYMPLWKACEEEGLPIGIHEGQLSYLPTLGRDRSEVQWAVHTMSHPFEQMAAMVTILEHELFGKFPKLNFLFLEGGTALWLPYWLNRLDAARHLYRGSPGGLLPSEYFERQGFVTCEVDDPFLPQTLSCVSDTKLLMSTDYPHQESPYPHSVKKFMEQKIDDASRMRIGTTNALTAYPRLAR